METDSLITPLVNFQLLPLRTHAMRELEFLTHPRVPCDRLSAWLPNRESSKHLRTENGDSAGKSIPTISPSLGFGDRFLTLEYPPLTPLAGHAQLRDGQ